MVLLTILIIMILDVTSQRQLQREQQLLLCHHHHRQRQLKKTTKMNNEQKQENEHQEQQKEQQQKVEKFERGGDRHLHIFSIFVDVMTKRPQAINNKKKLLSVQFSCNNFIAGTLDAVGRLCKNNLFREATCKRKSDPRRHLPENPRHPRSPQWILEYLFLHTRRTVAEKIAISWSWEFLISLSAPTASFVSSPTWSCIS